MIRLLCKIFKIEFEPCKGCEVHRQQLQIANEQIKYLTETLTEIVHPKVIPVEPPAKQVNLAQHAMSFSRRRAALEERDRNEARILQQSQFRAKPDKDKEINIPIIERSSPLGQSQSIEELEKELSIEEEVKNG